MRRDHVLVIGIGNEYRGDDSVGLRIARKLAAKSIPNVEVIEESGEGASLLEAWKGAQTVLLVDAVSSNAEPGAIHRFDAHAENIPRKFFHYSTHAFSVAEAVELARTMNQLPPRLIVFGIEGKNFQAGSKVSPEVESAENGVLDAILRMIDEP